MNLNELNPTQIILLTLLISFVTSIATGIVTVSLVNQAPPVVTDTIHKVYEKTVEKIVPGDMKATVIENNKTIIVSGEDFVIEAVKENSDSLARIYTSLENEEGGLEDEFVGMGLFITDDGLIVAQKQDFLIDPELSEKDYYLIHDKEKVKVVYDNSSFVSEEDGDVNDFIFVRAELPENEDIQFKNIEMGDSDSLELGQSVIVLGGEETDMLLTGIISNLTRDKIILNEGEEDASEKIVIEKIETNLNPKDSMIALIDMNGKVIGIKLTGGLFTPINKIQEKLE